MGAYQESVRRWVRAIWARHRPAVEFSVQRLSEATGIADPALYRIEKLEGKTSDKTLKAIAGAFGETMPGIVLDLGGLAQPEGVVGWIAEAERSLSYAKALASVPPATAPLSTRVAVAGRKRRDQPPDESQQAG